MKSAVAVRMWLVTGFALALVSGCDHSDSAPSAPAQADVTGATIRAEEVRRLGSVDGQEGSFGRIGGMALREDGSVATLDRMTRELIFLDSLGNTLKAIDGDHDGPGSLRGVSCCVSVGPSGATWVRAGQRFVGFDDDGSIVGEVPTIRRRTYIGYGLMFQEDGAYMFLNGGAPERMFQVDADGDTASTALPAFTSLHQGVDDLLTITTPSGRRATVAPLPFGETRLTAVRRDGHLARASSSNYRVEVFDSRGEPAWTARGENGAPALTAEQLDSAAAFIEPIIERAQAAGSEVAEFEWPSHDQVLRALWFDGTGRLWVQFTGVNDKGQTSADVYGRDGEFLFTAEWPGAISLEDGAAAGELAWGRSKGAFDIDVLVTLRFRGAPEAG